MLEFSHPSRVTFTNGAFDLHLEKSVVEERFLGAKKGSCFSAGMFTGCERKLMKRGIGNDLFYRRRKLTKIIFAFLEGNEQRSR